MKNTVRIKINNNLYELDEELVCAMAKLLFEMDESYSEYIDEESGLSQYEIEDVRLVLDEIEDSLIED